MSSKGGVGKSTACLAMALAAGGTVHILDLDQNRTIATWAETKAAKHEGLTIEACKPEEFTEVFARISARKDLDILMIDLPGFLSEDGLLAIGRSDVVIVPAGASQPDFNEAIKTFRRVHNISQIKGAPIPCKLLLTRLSPLENNRVQNNIKQQVEANKTASFARSLVERSSYKIMWMTGEAPTEIDPKANDEIMAVWKEVVAIIHHTEQQAKRKGVA